MATDLPEAANIVESTGSSCPQRSDGHGNKDAIIETTHADSRHRISQQACSGKESLTGTEISRGSFWYSHLIKIFWMWSQKITGTGEDGNGEEHSHTGEEKGHPYGGYCRKLCGVSPKEQDWSYHVTHAPPHRETTRSLVHMWKVRKPNTRRHRVERQLPRAEDGTWGEVTQRQ